MYVDTFNKSQFQSVLLVGLSQQTHDVVSNSIRRLYDVGDVA